MSTLLVNFIFQVEITSEMSLFYLNVSEFSLTIHYIV